MYRLEILCLTSDYFNDIVFVNTNYKIIECVCDQLKNGGREGEILGRKLVLVKVSFGNKAPHVSTTGYDHLGRDRDKRTYN